MYRSPMCDRNKIKILTGQPTPWYTVTTLTEYPPVLGYWVYLLPGTRYDPVVHRYTYLDRVYQVPVNHVGNNAQLWLTPTNTIQAACYTVQTPQYKVQTLIHTVSTVRHFLYMSRMVPHNAPLVFSPKNLIASWMFRLSDFFMELVFLNRPTEIKKTDHTLFRNLDRLLKQSTQIVEIWTNFSGLQTDCLHSQTNSRSTQIMGSVVWTPRQTVQKTEQIP